MGGGSLHRFGAGGGHDQTFDCRSAPSSADSTGLSSLDYIHALRLEEAKQILETEDAPIEAVAHQIGYEDASFFGRLFRWKVGLTPAQYRRRFGSLRRALRLK
jgi:AraC-like DNA-binding protein